jgi:2-polyprenyl-3-methyl-5-hydroxy-6-metoxy-1,4-benzoquinol methylase
MSSTATILSPVNGLPARFYCKKGPAIYYLEPKSGLIFQAHAPSVADMSRYADQEYSSGAYKKYAAARDLKIATARPRIAAIKTLATGRRLLDVGCATGFFLELAAAEGFVVHGVEFSNVAISLAREDIRANIICGDVNSLLKQGTDKFDVVTAFDIIEHVQDPVQFLEDIRTMLAPGGLLALSTPDTGHFLRYLMGSNWPMLQPMQHTVLFSRRSIAALFECCGFVEVKLETAHKYLTLDYLGDQFMATNPTVHRLYGYLRRLLPAAFRSRAFRVNIGEFVAYARKPR